MNTTSNPQKFTEIPSHWYLSETDDYASYMYEVFQAKLRRARGEQSCLPAVLPSTKFPVQLAVDAALMTDQLLAAVHNPSMQFFPANSMRD